MLDEIPLKIMKNDFYLILKALFALKIFKFLSWFFGHAEKTAWLDILGDFKIYHVTTWLKNYCNTLIA